MSRLTITDTPSAHIAELSDRPPTGADTDHESKVDFSAEWVLGDSVEDARFPIGQPG